jgi:hypothetical protein
VSAVELSAVEAFTAPLLASFATDPNSIARGGGLCPQGVGNGGTTDADCYVSATTDETGVDIINPSFDPVGVPHTFVFTCGPAVGADLIGNGATEPGSMGLPAGCYDVQATVKNESLGADPSIDFARCGYNTAHVTGSTANCNSTQSPLCPAAANGGAEPGTDQGHITGATDTILCATDDTGSGNGAFGQQVAVSINPGAPDSYLITFTGYTLVCGSPQSIPGVASTFIHAKQGTTKHITKTQANPGSPGTSCESGAPSDTNPGQGAVCPTGMTYLPGGTSGFALTASVGVEPVEVSLPVLEGVCQFAVQVEKKYIELNQLTLACVSPFNSGFTAGPPSTFTSTLLFSEGLKEFFGKACLLEAFASGIVVIKPTDCSQESGLIGTSAGFGTYECNNNVLEVVGVVPDAPVPITVTTTGPGGVSANLPGPSLISGGSNLCPASAGGVHSSIDTMTGPTGDVFLCPTGPGTGTVDACLASTADTQAGVCSNVVAFSYTVTAEGVQHELAALVTSGDVSPGVGKIVGALLRSASNLRGRSNCNGAAALYRLALRLVHIFTGHGVSTAAAAALNRDIQYLIMHCP